MQLSIRGFWVLLAGGYSAPVVTAVTPSTVGNGGGVVTVLGTHFGLSQCTDPQRPSWVRVRVSLAPSNPSALAFNSTLRRFDSGSLVQSLVECMVVGWNDSAVTCVAPPGLDPSVQVVVTAAGRSVSASGLLGWVLVLACGCGRGLSHYGVVEVRLRSVLRGAC